MRRFVIYISLLLILASFSSKAQTKKSFALNKLPKTIALINHKYLYFIRVTLNNRDAILLIDTGAASSLLDINQANDYNFKINRTGQKFAGAGGLSDQYRITNYIFHHDFQQLLVYPLGADLSRVVESFDEDGITVTGVLGSDFFNTHDAIIDYKNKLLTIHTQYEITISKKD